MAALLAGQGVNATADQFKIDKSVVCRWRQRLPSDVLDQVAANSADKFGKLLAEGLEMNLRTLKAIAEHAQDKKWLAQQGAAELGTFFGIVSDKTLRMFEAAESARSNDETSA